MNAGWWFSCPRWNFVRCAHFFYSLTIFSCTVGVFFLCTTCTVQVLSTKRFNFFLQLKQLWEDKSYLEDCYVFIITLQDFWKLSLLYLCEKELIYFRFSVKTSEKNILAMSTTLTCVAHLFEFIWPLISLKIHDFRLLAFKFLDKLSKLHSFQLADILLIFLFVLFRQIKIFFISIN